MSHTRLMAILATTIFLATFTETSMADHKSITLEPPALKIISPANGATIANPVVVVFETRADLSKMTMGAMMNEGSMDTMKARPHLHVDLDKRVTMPTMKHITKVQMNRYQYSLGSAKPGTHTIRVYWGDAKHHKAISGVRMVRVTVK